MGDVISGEGFWLFWLRLPALGPDARWKYFDQVFIGTRLKSESFEPLVSFSSISGSKVVAKTT